MSGADAFKCMFNLSPPCSIISIILFYNKEAASRTLCSVDATLDNLLIYVFQNVFIFDRYIFKIF